MQIVPLGDCAVLVRVGDAIDAETHARVRAVLDMLDREPVSGVIELVPAYTAVAVHYEPEAFAGGDGPFARVTAEIEDRLRHLEVVAPGPGRLIEVPVRYGGEEGPDLEELAHYTGLTPEQVVSAHAAAEYTVYMIGFSPGFPYLAGLPERLAMPRRDSPRVAVPQGSIGIGGRQTGIYPIQTPGGWRIIGRTSLRLFRPEADPPTLLQLGDRVRFLRSDQ